MSEQDSDAASKPAKKPQGFAAISPELMQSIAVQGARAAHQKGVAHAYDSDSGRRAGKKGGESVSKNRIHMSRIGTSGVMKREAKKRQRLSRMQLSIESIEATSSTESGSMKTISTLRIASIECTIESEE